ncbi:hypothetical protein [Desulfolucanica intricata]|uniref:hypothetical protein n=1 Tax=Desulfolucanica intricata TaxID=1285191 RepID=UPI00082E182E|nr:hypothetical protein [Desulfolucanica intricata]
MKDKVDLKQFKVIENFIITAFITATSLFILLLFFARWPGWWELTIPELSPMTWIESLILFSIAFVGCLIVMLCYLKKDFVKLKWWGIFTFGFLYLTLDERFALHERIRDRLLAPHEIKIPLFFWTDYGDFIMLVFLITGILFSIKLLRLLKERKAAYRWFIAGICFTALAVILDSFSFTEYSLELQRLQQFGEEVLEVCGMLSFFSSTFLIFNCYLQKLLGLRINND